LAGGLAAALADSNTHADSYRFTDAGVVAYRCADTFCIADADCCDKHEAYDNGRADADWFDESEADADRCASAHCCADGANCAEREADGNCDRDRGADTITNRTIHHVAESAVHRAAENTVALTLSA
jgi:hypothetical protein